MGMGLMGVVATQHIREEYDDEDDEDEDEYGAEQAPPVNEGGGPSSSNENNYDQIVYHTNEPQKTAPSISHPQRIAASKTTQKFKPQEEEDDESNINSDEQNEYLDSQENYPIQREPKGYYRPGTATGNHGSSYPRMQQLKRVNTQQQNFKTIPRGPGPPKKGQ